MAQSAPIDPDEELRLELIDQESALSGCAADIVIVYPIEDEDTLKHDGLDAMEKLRAHKPTVAKLIGRSSKQVSKQLKEDLDEIHHRNEARASTITKMRSVGLNVVKQRTRNGKRMLVKVTAPLKRLEQEAQRLGIEMRLRKEFNEQDDRSTPTYRDFDMAMRDMFERKEGRLFSTLERQRLIFSIIEGPEFEGCAQLDLDGLVNALPSNCARALCRRLSLVVSLVV